MTTIFASLGKKRYVGGTITELTGKDISGATFTIALSSDGSTPPAVFVPPDVNQAGSTVASRVVKKLVDSTVTPGTYFLWCTVNDFPEIEPMVLQGPIVVA